MEWTVSCVVASWATGGYRSGVTGGMIFPSSTLRCVSFKFIVVAACTLRSPLVLAGASAAHVPRK